MLALYLRIVRLKLLEEDVAEKALARAEAKGTTLANKPTWFQNPTSRADAEGHRAGACWPIEKVVEWSRTIRGGAEEDKQELLFASHNDGCMRWGLCDTGADK